MKIVKGKYKDKTVEYVFKNDYTYFEWLLLNGNKVQSGLREYCKKYLDDYIKIQELDKLELKEQLDFYDNMKSIYKEKKEEPLKTINIF